MVACCWSHTIASGRRSEIKFAGRAAGPTHAGLTASPCRQAEQRSHLEDLDGLSVLPPGGLEEVAELGDLLGHSDGGLALVASPAAGGGGDGNATAG